MSKGRGLHGFAVVTLLSLAIAGAAHDGGVARAASPAPPNWGTHGSVRIRNVRFAQLLEDRSGRTIGVGLFDNKRPLGSHATVVRLRPDGTLDGSFGKGGFADVPAARQIGWTGGAILGNGKIVVVGTDRYGIDLGDAHVVLARLDATGRPDTAFGTGGYLTLHAPGCVHGATGIAPGKDGGFVVALLHACSFKGAHTPILTRFAPNGAVVGGGAALGESPWQVVPATPILPLPDGSFVIASFAKRTAALQLTRIRAEGTKDAGFHGQETRVGAGPFGLRLTGLFLARLGRLTVTGCSQAGPFLARFNRDGSPYKFWGGPAIGRTNVENFGGGFGSPCAAFAQLRNYKLAAAGTALVHLYPGGILDPHQPIAPLPAFSPTAEGPAHLLLALSDGSVVVSSQLERDTVLGRYR